MKNSDFKLDKIWMSGQKKKCVADVERTEIDDDWNDDMQTW